MRRMMISFDAITVCQYKQFIRCREINKLNKLRSKVSCGPWLYIQFMVLIDPILEDFKFLISPPEGESCRAVLLPLS